MYFSRQILFSRTFQDSPVHLSTSQACGNPGAVEISCCVEYERSFITLGPGPSLNLLDRFYHEKVKIRQEFFLLVDLQTLLL